MQRIVTALRNRMPRPIQIFHSDLPTNNFNQLFASLGAVDPSFSPQARVNSAAVGDSMFEQLLPPRMVTIATTFNALGFLERRPQAEIPDYILPMGPGRPRPGVSVTSEARNVFANRAGDDLIRFYRARAEETVAGGKLLIATFGADEHYRCCDGLFDLLNDALLDLRDAGRLDRQVYRRFCFRIYFRTRDELVAPLLRDASPVAGCFHVDRVESIDVPVPLTHRWEPSGDTLAYAEEFTGFIRAFSELILRQSFSDHVDREAVLEEVYERVRAGIIADPAERALHAPTLCDIFDTRSDCCYTN
jgi:gibberellin A4 carboxyl methyltransferase